MWDVFFPTRGSHNIPLLVLLHNPRPFTLACVLILLFQTPFSTSKTFLALVPLQPPHLTFLLSLLTFSSYFPLSLCFFCTEVGILSSLPLPFPSQSQGCVPLAMASLRLLWSSLDYTHPSLLVLYALCSTSCILSHVLLFLHCCPFYLCF